MNSISDYSQVVIVPLERLTQELQLQVVKEFLWRQMDDANVESFDQKHAIEQVLSQLRQKLLLVVYEAESESIDIIHRDFAIQQGIL